MAAVIFFAWYLTMGLIFWKVRTNVMMQEQFDNINKILEMSGELKAFVWYVSMAVVVIFWPIFALRQVLHRLKLK